MNWIDQKLPLILAVAALIGLIWRSAMDHEKTKASREETANLKMLVAAHISDGNKHLDPIRDERRLAHIEEKLEQLLRIVLDIRTNTKAS